MPLSVPWGTVLLGVDACALTKVSKDHGDHEDRFWFLSKRRHLATGSALMTSSSNSEDSEIITFHILVTS